MTGANECKTDQREAKQLGPGQLWRLKKRYVLIVALENLCVQFKLMDAPDTTGERTLTGDIDTLWRYLKSRRAKLVEKGNFQNSMTDWAR
jgi:hypothetical protein